MNNSTLTAQEVTTITELLGHRPTDRVIKIVGDLNALVAEYCAAHPGTTEADAWDKVKQALDLQA